jgi:HNH endonuclease
MPVERKKVSLRVKTEVLTEAGYRCAVPSCRTLLLLDLHHMYQVSEGGGDTTENLIPLCPNDHARYHRGEIPKEAIFAYKSILVAISRAFDLESMDRLLFLEALSKDFLKISGDGVLIFGRLIAAGLASVKLKANNNDLIVTYTVNVSQKGRLLVNAWRSGDHAEIARAVAGPVPGLNSTGRVP